MTLFEEFLDILLEARRDPNLKGMGNLNSLDPGLKKLLASKLSSAYYKFSNKDSERRRSFSDAIGTGSLLKPIGSPNAEPKTIIDEFKEDKEALYLVIVVNGQQLGILSKDYDRSKNQYQYGVGVSQELIKLLHSRISGDPAAKNRDDELAKGMARWFSPKTAERLAMYSLRNHHWSSSVSTPVALSFISDLTKMYGNVEQPEVKYLVITVDKERKQLKGEREAAKRGVVPKDEFNKYANAAIRKKEFGAIENLYYFNDRHGDYINGLRKALRARLDAYKVRKKTEEAPVVNSEELHKLLQGGRFHDRFRMMFNGKEYNYDYETERNVNFDALVKAQRNPNERYYHNTPYISFKLRGADDYSADKRALWAALRELEKKAEAGELPKEEAEKQEAELVAKHRKETPPNEIYMFLKLTGGGLTVDGIQLRHSSAFGHDEGFPTFEVTYDKDGYMTGLKPVAPRRV